MLWIVFGGAVVEWFDFSTVAPLWANGEGTSFLVKTLM